MNTRKVLIAGSGIAAWMTAARLSAVLNRDGRKFAEIRLLSSPDSSVRTLGEMTTSDVVQLLAILGIDHPQFMRRVGGTFRQAGKFVNWLSNSGEYYYHTISTQRPGVVDQSAQRWLKSNRSEPFVETVSAQPRVCELNLAPLMLRRGSLGAPLPYAFHVDQQRLASFLRETSLASGVMQCNGELVDVELGEGGDIAALQSSSGERIEADLFVDCTGSAGLLIGQVSDTARVDFSDRLICDRSLSIEVPYEQHYPGYVRPYTTTTAMSSGWMRDIPLQNSRSVSFVYCSDFLSDDGAEHEIRAAEGPHADALASTLQPFQSGRRMNAWVRNCVAIGAASACVDPLEPSSLYLIDHAADMLAEHFPLGKELSPLAYRYNRIMSNRLYEIVDFANLHYCLTRRTDTDFWREVQRPARIGERLQAKLDYWRIKPPTMADFEDQCFPGQSQQRLPESPVEGDYRAPVDTARLWSGHDYECVLYGMNFLSKECSDWYGSERPDSQVPIHVVERLRSAPQKLPSHAQWLQRFCDMPDYANPRGARR